MCFGGGSSRPEPVSPTVTQEQKEQKKEETQKKVERRQEALEKEVTSDTRLKHNLLMRWAQSWNASCTRKKREKSFIYKWSRWYRLSQSTYVWLIEYGTFL